VAVYGRHIVAHGPPNGRHQGPALTGTLMLLLAGQLLVRVGLGPELLEEVHDVV